MKEMSYNILGTMSGTSLDGLDLALCHFTQRDSGWEYTVRGAATYLYPEVLRIRLEKAMELSAYDFINLDLDLARSMADTINRFLTEYAVKPDFIASHGHTTFHQPLNGLTCQIGNRSVIAARTGITTICDFRSVDVALGGQGAPLVPIGDELLFGSYDACLNLGGFSNISFRKDGRRIAFDISPCNMALNYLAGLLEMPFDRDGKISRKGKINHNLLDKLNQIDFYRQLGAKSLGKEWFDSVFRPYLDTSAISVTDKLRTITEHIAIQLANASQGMKGETMLVTGGGARNVFLIERLREIGNKKIIIPDVQTTDFKEAIIFAFLGLLRVKEKINCLSDVTGAKSDNCGGAVYIGSGNLIK